MITKTIPKPEGRRFFDLMSGRRLFVYGCLLAIPTASMALTKEEILKHVAAKVAVPNYAYEAIVKTKIHMGGTTMMDSGKMIFSPPDCFKMVMYKAKTENMGCGDTTWVKTSNGGVTRNINQNGSGSPLGQMGMTADLEKMDFKVIEEIAGKYVVLEVNTDTPEGKIKMKMTYDSKEWLPRKNSFLTPTGESVDIGYAYEKFHGHTLLNEVRTVMGNGGFVTLSFMKFKKVKKQSRSAFKGF